MKELLGILSAFKKAPSHRSQREDSSPSFFVYCLIEVTLFTSSFKIVRSKYPIIISFEGALYPIIIKIKLKDLRLSIYIPEVEMVTHDLFDLFVHRQLRSSSTFAFSSKSVTSNLFTYIP